MQISVRRDGQDVSVTRGVEPSNDLFKSQQVKHPSAGSWVTITGKHSLSGYHGMIYGVVDMDDEMEPRSFVVHVDAKSSRVVIDRTHLRLRQYVFI